MAHVHTLNKSGYCLQVTWPRSYRMGRIPGSAARPVQVSPDGQPYRSESAKCLCVGVCVVLRMGRKEARGDEGEKGTASSPCPQTAALHPGALALSHTQMRPHLQCQCLAGKVCLHSYPHLPPLGSPPLRPPYPDLKRLSPLQPGTRCLTIQFHILLGWGLPV